ncbi:condensin-2 complex subunit D3 [Parasteatoda tepidariorum]|uniref:condensin-2 complex subunit D3 n=1 Tax=Parasteatoda tepidariorum TaxID=114398 RepID=UPI001C719857|nr:condensin-2 complex subunit D3 [Parasteatoda tepidariorum]
MFDRDSLLNDTNTYFDSINFGEINERWIDEVIENEYNDVEENPMTTSILFADDPFKTLDKICLICEKWFERQSNVSEDSSFATNTDDSAQEEVLWTFLNNLDISVKQVLGMIYLLCSKALKTSSSLEDKKLGLVSARFYFICLKIPGSSAYSVFHPNLYRTCVDCLQMPSHVPETKDTVYVWRDFEALLPAFISTLDALIPLLNDFHLGSDITTVDFTIQKLTELFACEASNNKLNFDVNLLDMSKDERRRRYSRTSTVTLLVSQGMLILARAEMNGDKESNCSFILSGLNTHILCAKIKKATTIPHKFVVIKDNAVSFVKYNLAHNQELFSKPTETTLKRLCLQVSDKSDFRATVSYAIFAIMFDLVVCDLVEFLQWLLLLVDSADTNNRTFALEVLGLLLSENVPGVDKTGLPDSAEVYLTPIPVIFSILTRCDDIASGVRSKALTVISQHTKKLLESLTEFMKDPSTAKTEDLEEIVESDVNGENRAFWYNLDYRGILDEIAAIIYRRAEDSSANAKKAALQALENLILFDPVYLSADYLKLFVTASKDAILTSRKQVIQSVTTILDAYPNNHIAQDYWLQCITPLVHDPETTVQAKALAAMEDRFLHHVFSNKDDLKDCAFSLLEKLSIGQYLSHQRYLQKSFSLWKTDKKLNLNVANIEKSFGHGRDESIWFFLSVFSAFAKLSPKLSERAVDEFQEVDSWKSYSYMENILKLLGYTYTNISPSKLDLIRGTLMTKLKDFSASLENLPMMIEVLKKIEKHLNNLDEFETFAREIVQLCETCLSKAVQNNDDSITDEVLAKCLAISTEICHIFPSQITQQLTDTLKPFHSVRKSYERITPFLRAHAFACVGKIALQDESLAKEILPEVAYELIHSQEDAIRNNVAIILIEMCKRYTSLADRYVPIISRCFKDRVYLIRYQTITMLVNLLQEGYIKYKGTLFYCILSTVIDKKESIRELGKYCLLELLVPKKKSIFSDHFVDSIFVFNGYGPPDNENLRQLIQDLEIFALKGTDKAKERMQLYTFMLVNMDATALTFLVIQIVQNILMSVAENVFPLNSDTENMVRDCFAILNSPDVRPVDIDNYDLETDADREKFASAEKETRKLMLIDPVVPAVISLKNCVMSEKSGLLEEIIFFLKEFLQDFKSEVNVIISDKTLLQQINLEYRKDMVQQEKENKKDPKKAPVSTQNGDIDPSTAVAMAKERTDLILQKELENIRRESGMNGRAPHETSLRLVSRTPLNKSTARKPAPSQSMEIDPTPGTSSNGSSEFLPSAGENFSSTPRVVLTQLKLPKTPDISSLVFHIDSDSD